MAGRRRRLALGPPRMTVESPGTVVAVAAPDTVAVAGVVAVAAAEGARLRRQRPATKAVIAIAAVATRDRDGSGLIRLWAVGIGP